MADLRLFDHSKKAFDAPAGQTVFAEGDAADVMYALIGGKVEIRAGGRLLQTIGAGELFGEMALIDDGPRSATAVVLEDARLVPVDRGEFTHLVQEHPTFAVSVMRIMADRLRHSNAHV
jgi:CRP/FNR family transcriptional regulator, cyclic AMP receptor protein